jgi:hypothetical protein
MLPTMMMVGKDNTITHTINAGNNDILYRQTDSLQMCSKVKYVRKTVTDTQLGRQ